MADITITRSKHRQTLTAATAQDFLHLAASTGGARRYVRITNHTGDAGSTTDLSIRYDGTTAVSAADGTFILPGGMYDTYDLDRNGAYGDKRVSVISPTAVVVSVEFFNA